LDQAVKDIAQTIDTKGNDGDNNFEVFVIVQRGLDIGFFEYTSAQSVLDEDEVFHFRGCVSLTQDHGSKGAVVPSTTGGLKKLMFEDEKLRGVTNQYDQGVRKDAEDYKTPCIFNIDEHEHEINQIMNHILKNQPRGS
jgi:hypothetical protein